mgnify:CR=1 FL=1
MPNRSKQKGKRAEYYIRNFLRELFPEAEIERVPNSGNHKKFYGDIILNNFVIEVKYRSEPLKFLPEERCYDGTLHCFTLENLQEEEKKTEKFHKQIYTWIDRADGLIVKISHKKPVFFLNDNLFNFFILNFSKNWDNFFQKIGTHRKYKN